MARVSQLHYRPQEYSAFFLQTCFEVISRNPTDYGPIVGALDAGGHCVFGMPSGTGKVVSLLSLIVAYQHSYHANRSTAFVQCPRSRGLEAGLKGLMAYKSKELRYLEEIRGLRLTIRKNLCQHSSVRGEGNRKRLPHLRPFQLFHTGSFTLPVLLLTFVSNIPIMDLLAQIKLIIWHQVP